MGKKAKTAQTAAPVVSNGVERQQSEKTESASKANGTSMPPAPVPTPTKPSAERNEFLKLFWNLAESDAAARAQAVAHIIAHLQQKQTKADATFDEDLQYTLKRLVRGLASSRDAARQGFSTALAGLLETFPSVQLKEVQDLLREAMEVHSSMKGMEQREHMFGRLFGLLAVQRSGRLGGDDNQSVAVEVIKELLEMSKWKKWLREACFEAVLAVLVDVNTKVFVSDLVPEFSLYLQGDVSAFNAEQVLLAAGLHHYIHTAGLEDEVPSTFPALKFLRRKAMHALIEPLKTSSSCYPRVHAAWYGIFGHLIHTGKNAAQFDVELFQETWNVLVENVLLNKESATHERRGLAFKLFELVLPSLPSSLLRAILTPHFVKCLYTNAISKKNYLHEAARHTLKVFATLAPEEYFHFFQKQFVKPMASLVEIDADDNGEDDEENSPEAKKARLSSGGFDAIIAIEEEKERAELLKKKHDNVRLWALDALVTSVSELLAKDDSEATEETNEKVQNQVLRFLVFHTFFVSSGKATPSKKKKKSAAGAGASDVGLDAALTIAEPVLSNTVLATSLKRVLSLLSVKLSGESSSVLSRIFSISQELLAVGDAATLRHALADDVVEQMKTVASRVSEIRKSWASAQEDKEDEAKTKQLEAFLLLFMSSGVQLLDPEQRSDAVVVVTDLEKCYSDLVTDKKAGSKKKAGKKTKKQEAETESEPNSIVVFTDMLMSLLSQDSSAMREIVAHVFRSMLPLLNAESIQTMLNVLVPSEEDDAEDQEDDRVTRRDDEDQEDSDEDMEGGDDEEEGDEIVLTTATEVSEALSKDAKLAALHREDMALAAIVGHVKDRANRKKNAKKAVMQMLHFKLRVLDLLQVFVTKCATSPLVLSLVLPLFQALIAIQKTDKEARVLSERLQSVLNNKVLRAKDVPSGAELDAAERTAATENLNTVVELLTKKSLDKDQAGKVGAGVVVYYIRVLCGGKTATAASSTQGVQQAVRVAVIDAFTKKHSRFPQSVFDDLIARFPLIAVHLLLAPLTAIATASEKEGGADDSEGSEGFEGSKTAVAVDEFSKCEVFRLLSLLLKPKMLAEKDEQKAFVAVKTPLKSALVALLAQELKAKRMKIVLSFALHFVKSWKLVTKDNTKELEELMTVFTSLETNSPVVKNMVKQIVDASGSSIAAAALEKKDKADKIKKSEEDKAKKAKEQTPQAEEKAAEKAKKQLQKAVADKKKKSQMSAPLKKRKRAAAKADESDEE